MSDSILIGSFVHLKNKKLGYLDTCEWVKNEPHFAQYSDAKAMIRTSNVPDRDNGSGTWQIVSTDGKANGTPLDNTAQIHLRNCYHNSDLGYLALFDKISDTDVATLIAMDDQYFGGGAYVFTASLEGRFAGAIGPASFALPLVANPPDHQVVPITIGSNVKIRCCIQDNDYNISRDNHYLQAFGPLDKLGMLQFGGTRETGTGLVFSSPTESVVAPNEDYQIWEISLSEYQG